MDIYIEWQKPVQVTRSKKIILDEKKLPSVIKDKDGVYFFSRKHGKTYKPFYIGETFDIKRRLREHLSSRKLADVLRGIDTDDFGIKQGERYFHYGYIKLKSSQDKKKYLGIVQRYLIQEAMAQNLPLLNTQLTKRLTHTLKFEGDKIGKAIYGESAEVPARR